MARAVIVALVAAWSPSLRAEGRPAYGGSVHAVLSSAPVAIDPLSTVPGDLELAPLLFDAPFRCDGARPRPHLALGLDNPDGALRARLRLRPDARFHDGAVLRAADVAESLARALRGEAGWTLGPVRAARAVGDDVVELELARPAPDLPLLLCTPAAAVARPSGPARRLVGTGPFLVDAKDPQGVRLAAHAAHFGGRPFLDALALRAFASAADESASFQVGALQAAHHGAGGTLARHPTAGASAIAVAVEGAAAVTVYLALGRELPPPLVGPLARALALGVDRERLRRLVPGPSLPSSEPAYDPARARALLAPALAGGRLPARLLVDGSRLDDRALADRLLVELARLGVDLTVETVDAAAFDERRAAGRYQLLLGRAAPPAPDAGLAELAVLAAVDPAGARAILAHGPARPGGGAAAGAPVIPLFRRGARWLLAPSLSGASVDGAGRVSWADVHILPVGR
jgi:MarR-like DNA-binding transcriptional regulator SgrR of sgrS sRNA